MFGTIGGLDYLKKNQYLILGCYALIVFGGLWIVGFLGLAVFLPIFLGRIFDSKLMYALSSVGGLIACFLGVPMIIKKFLK